jgi:hypothetical protein
MSQKLSRNIFRSLSSSTKKSIEPIVFSTPAIHNYREKKELTTNFEIPLSLNPQQAVQSNEEKEKKVISEIQFSVPVVGKAKAKFQSEVSSPMTSVPVAPVGMADPSPFETRMKDKLSNNISTKERSNNENKFNFSHLLFGVGIGAALGSFLTFLLIKFRVIEIGTGGAILNEKESQGSEVGMPRWLQFPSQTKN